MVQIMLLIFSVLSGIYVFKDCNKRNMSTLWSVSVIIPVFGLIFFTIYLFLRKPIDIELDTMTLRESNLNSNSSFNTTITPETCPHCKSPNTQKNRICEWCGNQIV